jgi:CheY-like chemotaxis protein
VSISMHKNYSGSAVPRHFVFIMSDGAFVVQWDENRVQDILTGEYRVLERDGFGHAVSDYELNQLVAAGRVEHYNRSYVWLYALPEPNRFQTELKTQERIADRVRAYYLNTTQPASQLEVIAQRLEELGLSEAYSAQIQGGLVAVAGRDGTPFLYFSEVEEVQRLLAAEVPELFQNAAIAFIEMRPTDETHDQIAKRPEDNTDLTMLIASQMDTSVTRDKQVVVLLPRENEQFLVRDLCLELQMEGIVVTEGWEALNVLEDEHPDLLIMDLELPDMHGWEMISKVKEIDALRNLPIIVIAEQSPDQPSLAFTVAQVDVYLTRPLSRARLRQNIWMAFKNQNT